MRNHLTKMKKMRGLEPVQDRDYQVLDNKSTGSAIRVSVQQMKKENRNSPRNTSGTM